MLKSRDVTLPTKVCLVKAMVFLVVMYGCESWTIEKAECRRIDAFELWCWRRPLRVPWTARRSNQSILKEISPGCSLEGLMLKLKLQYFGHVMWRADSFEKTLMLGKIKGRRRKEWQDEMVGWHHRLNGHEFGWAPGVGDGQGGLEWCSSWGPKEPDTTQWQLNWCHNNGSLSTLGPSDHNYWVRVLQLLKPARPEPVCHKKPPQWEAWAPKLEGSPCCLQLEKAYVQQRSPSAAKDKERKKYAMCM